MRIAVIYLGTDFKIPAETPCHNPDRRKVIGIRGL
jgi:hypothetical protein